MRQPSQFLMGTSDDPEMSTPESPTIQQMLGTICFDISVDLMIAKIGLSLGVLPTPNPGEDNDHAVLFNGGLYTASPECDEGKSQH